MNIILFNEYLTTAKNGLHLELKSRSDGYSLETETSSILKEW